MSRVGRKRGFLIGASYAIGAGLLAAYAISIAHFYLFCIATFFLGSHNAFMQQYRFAAAELVPTDKVATALSIIMLAGVGAAYIGPEVAERMQFTEGLEEFAGSFIALSGLLCVTFVALCFYPNTAKTETGSDAPQRSLLEIIGQRTFIIAAAAGAVGYAVMSFIMTATPLSMRHGFDHSMNDTTWVIQSHIMAMYLPSLFSGALISRFGAHRIIAAGIVLMCICVAVAYHDSSLMHFWWALVLLGVGWNFLFLGGTTLLTKTYRHNERFKVQAFNDFVIFVPQAMAALGSGLVLANWGWHGVLVLSLPWVVVLIPLLWFGRRPTLA